MKKKILLISMLVLTAISLTAQNDTPKKNEQLDTIQIVSHYDQKYIEKIPRSIQLIKLQDLKTKPVESIDDILETLSGVDVRTRGSKGIQSDLSLRGGNFDQVLILLNGIKINNTQTGHHNLDLPVEISMLDHIEILEGPAGQTFGINSYSGVINLVTKKSKKNQAYIHAEAGQFGFLKTDLGIQHHFGKIYINNNLSYKKSDGYLQNSSINNTDFYALKDYLDIKFQLQKLPINLQAGFHQKAFGANSFYTSKYPWQFEKTKGYFIHLNTSFGKKIIIKPNLNYKIHFDEFQLFRESRFAYQDGFFVHQKDTAQLAPGYFYKEHNHHQTKSVSANVRVKFKNSLGKTNLNFSYGNDQILSNVLGEKLDKPITKSNRITYNKKDVRAHFETNINHTKKIGKWHLGLGGTFLYSAQYQSIFSGGLYFSYINRGFTHYFSANNAARLPSFTDLYYAGPINKGNPNLKPEKATSFEVGTKYKHLNFFASAAIFFRKGNNTIDWIKTNTNDKWQTQNLTELQTFGFELSLRKRFKEKWMENIDLSYAFLNMDKLEDEKFISKYALDYLKHKLSLNITHKAFYGLKINWSFIYKNRAGKYLDYIDKQYKLFDYPPYLLTNVKLYRNFNKFDLGLNIENLFNTDYRDLSYIKMPGRWIIFQVNYSITK